MTFQTKADAIETVTTVALANALWHRIAAETTTRLVADGVHEAIAIGAMLDVAVTHEARRRGLADMADHLRRIADLLSEQADANRRVAH